MCTSENHTSGNRTSRGPPVWNKKLSQLVYYISRIWAHWPPHAFPHFGEKGGKKETKRLLEQSIVRLATKSKLRETQTLTMIQVWPHTKLELNFLFRDAAT